MNIQAPETNSSSGSPETSNPPLDIFGTAYGAPELPEQSLPPVIERFARDEAERLGVDPGMIAVPALAVGSAALGDFAGDLRVKRHDDWHERSRLWVAVVAPPSGTKSPALAKAMEPLREIEAEWLQADTKAVQRYEAELALWNKRKSAIDREHTSKSKRDIPAEQVAALYGTPPLPVRQRRKVVNDAAIEALSKILADNPGGVMVFRDELTGWIGSMDAYRSHHAQKDRAAWLELHNGGRFTVDRAGSGHTDIANWSACIVGGIQPGRVRSMDLTPDGLLQRFIVIYTEQTTPEVDRAPDKDAQNAYRKVAHALAKHPFMRRLRKTADKIDAQDDQQAATLRKREPPHDAGQEPPTRARDH